MPELSIEVNDAFRVASDDEYFFEGTVREVTVDYIEVDFGDWIQRYPRSAIREGFDCASTRYLGAGLEPGVVRKDYRHITMPT